MLCCGDVVTKLWEKEFETPGNAEPDWQPGLLLEIQDDGSEVPYTHRREWSFFDRYSKCTCVCVLVQLLSQVHLAFC